jgi:arylsulfatase A-like enzyme
MTGCYPDLAGVPGVIRTNETNSWGYLREDIVTLPQILKSVGYHTALIGKWHLGLESPNIPNERGFDFFHGFLGDMMDDYWTHLRQGNNYMRLNNEIIEPEGHATDIFSDWAIEYIKSAENDESPFFLYLAYNAPHFPIQPPEEWLKKVMDREKGISEKRAKNVALVEHLDDGIGRVLEALEKTKQDRNTLIVFSSDNGGHLPSGASNGNLRGGKQDMYEGGIKVPTCFVWKEGIKSGTVCENLGLSMDIYPTICEITGIQAPDKVNGLSLYHSLQGKDQVTDNRVVYFMRREGGSYGGLCYYAARQGQYKLLQNSPFEAMQLFNLKTDPLERIPLEETSDKFKDLKFRISQHIREAGKIPWQK